MTEELVEYWESLTPAQRRDWAARAGTSRAYLGQIVHGFRSASHGMAQALVRASDGKVTLEWIRPDIYGSIKEKNGRVKPL